MTTSLVEFAGAPAGPGDASTWPALAGAAVHGVGLNLLGSPLPLTLLVMAWVGLEGRSVPAGVATPGVRWHAAMIGLGLALAAIGPDRWWPGLALVGAGVGLRQWSIHTLGSWFRDPVEWLPRQPRIVTGPYRWLRHPSELGTLGILFGAALATRSLPGLVWACAVALPFGLARARAEERVFRARGAGGRRHRP